MTRVQLVLGSLGTIFAISKQALDTPFDVSDPLSGMDFHRSSPLAAKANTPMTPAVTAAGIDRNTKDTTAAATATKNKPLDNISFPLNLNFFPGFESTEPQESGESQAV